MQVGSEKRVEVQVFLAQHLGQYLLVETRLIDDADFGLQGRNLVYDVPGSGLPDGELILFGVD